MFMNEAKMKKIDFEMEDYLFLKLKQKVSELGLKEDEIIRSALIKYLTEIEDVEDNLYIEQHKNDEEVSIEDVFE